MSEDSSTLPAPVLFARNWDMLRLICVEYLEMPGLRLTPEQAQRFWRLDEDTCIELLDSLVDISFLRRMKDGRYTRADRGGHASRRRHSRERP
jgi:hypothetical protein